MKRLATTLGTLIALMVIVPAAEAGSYSFSIGGHRFHVEAARNCRSASCVSVSSRNLRPADNVGTAPVSQRPPAPVVQAPQPAYPEAPVRPSPATAVVPPPADPVLAATNSQPVVPPPPRVATSDGPASFETRFGPGSAAATPSAAPAAAFAPRFDGVMTGRGIY